MIFVLPNYGNSFRLRNSVRFERKNETTVSYVPCSANEWDAQKLFKKTQQKWIFVGLFKWILYTIVNKYIQGAPKMFGKTTASGFVYKKDENPVLWTWARKRCLAELLLNKVELHLPGLIGTASHPVIQKIRIIGFLFENRLHWQLEVGKKFTNGCFRVQIYLRANKTLVHNSLFVVWQ